MEKRGAVPQKIVASGRKSPVGQLENVDLDDYDEETDEFAGYSGSTNKPVS